MNITEIPLARAITATSVALVLACSVRANSGQTSHPATSKGAADVSRIAPPADMDRIGIKNGAWVIPDDVDLAQSSWRRAMDEHRARQRAKFGPVNRPDQLKKAFVETEVFLYDRRLYDAETGRWRFDEFLDRGQEQFGGYDQAILWQSYPRLGIDDRDQFDHYRDLPGGLGALREWVKACHRRGTRVLITYNPWDRNARTGNSHLRGVLETLKARGADRVYLDTLHAVPKGWTEAVKKARSTHLL